jgi:hypothetical protein
MWTQLNLIQLEPQMLNDTIEEKCVNKNGLK